MGKRSRHKSRHVRATTAALLGPAVRKQCTECGDPVEWITADQAQSDGIDIGPALEFLEVDHSDEIWACPSCGNFGVMGPTQFGFA